MEPQHQRSKFQCVSEQPFVDSSADPFPPPADILDIKPVNMEELTEVITAAEFHPVSCNLFCYSSSKGTVKLADMREQALCDKHAKRESAMTRP